jgi:hypothetical protein
MAQFNIRLSDKILRPDTISSVRIFAERTDWHRLPSSAHLHAGVISVVLRPPDIDTSLAEKGLLLLANQRMILYLSSTGRSDDLWLSWVERIEDMTDTYLIEDYDALQLCKDKMELSTEMITKSIDIFHTKGCASEVLNASANEISESANIQTINTSDERITSALAIAKLAKEYSFDENSKPPALSIWAKITSGLLGR